MKPILRFIAANPLFTALVSAFVLLGLLLPLVDRDWTLRLYHAASPAFASFMARTMFEGDLPGGGDLVVIGLAVAIIGYLLASFGWDKGRLQRWLPSFGYAIFGALVSAVCLVHGPKWFIGRARPSAVLNKGYAYSDWYQFGSHYLTEGSYRGSFPSGHTLAAFLLMLAAYILAGDRRHPQRQRLLGWLVGLLALGYAGSMAVSRSMLLAHWISDGTLGILLGWMLQHACYYWVLKVPQQNHLERPLELPRLFELRLGLHAVGFTAGLTLLLLGLRALALPELHPLLLLIPLGALLGGWFLRRGLALHTIFRCRLAAALAVGGER